jgi:S-adenosylmethionine/arginine decarboxylase-like enzyme
MDRQNMNIAPKVVDLSQGYRRSTARQTITKNVWGIAAAIDIYDCDPLKIRDAEYIRRFVVDLCELIDMKRFGETQIVHFGEDERVTGFSMVQLIETSLISAHFANLSNTVYLDVFSCKPYDTEAARSFSQSYFDGSYSNLNVTLRL